MDGSTIPRVPSLRSSVPVRDPRPGCNIFNRTRRSFKGNGGSGHQDAGSCTERKCILRETNRHDPARVSGLDDSIRRGSPPTDLAGMEDSLQPRATSLVARTWNPRAAPSQDSDQRPPARTDERLPHNREECSRRITSRIWLGEGGCLTAGAFIAEHKADRKFDAWLMSLLGLL